MIRFVLICLFFISLNTNADPIPSADEIFKELLPYEQNSRGLTIKKKEKASISFDMINFEFDSDVITLDSKPLLKNIGEAISREELKSNSFMIIGHTDSKGGADYNQTLSEKRAKSVKYYLITNFDIQPNRFIDIGKGESELLPEVPGDDAKNRRVEISTIIN